MMAYRMTILGLKLTREFGELQCVPSLKETTHLPPVQHSCLRGKRIPSSTVTHHINLCPFDRRYAHLFMGTTFLATAWGYVCDSQWSGCLCFQASDYTLLCVFVCFGGGVALETL
ncbi:hypothetical protein DPX16_6177 [Anabarilius grahami]|uniref:Uncharacterized protein n=1 Tax=Anabarilius grahami TaxID=495550 RepID=A0A3N0Z2L7_ANAGA|nr:hypothetical protein DPX16_6177 [Anabarilius grahami]